MRIQHRSSYIQKAQSLRRQIEASSGAKATAYAVAFAVLALLGVLFQEAAFGQTIVIIYGVCALVARVPSEDTFKMALISLVCIPILSVLRSDVLADNFAVYAFLLLCFGVVSAIREQWAVKKPAAAPALAMAEEELAVPLVRKPVFKPTTPTVRPSASASGYVSRKNVQFVNRRDRAKQPRTLNSPLS
jgi:hypothetical protein